MSTVVNSASESIYEALKYIYYIAGEDFYHINVKDIFKISLRNITDSGILGNLGIKLYPETIGDLKNPEFAQVKKLISYAFAVRLPYVRRYLPTKSAVFTENDVKELFRIICEAGAENVGGIISMDLKSNLKAARAKDAEEPFFDTEWFKTWVYTCGKEFSVINNRNMFFLGAADALFPLYWSALTDKLVEMVENS